MKKIKKLVCLLIFTFMVVCVSIAHAEYNRDNHTYQSDNGTEFGVQDDLVVLGTGGGWEDPDVEIYGFSIFGSTIGITPKISASTGSVFIGGNLQVNSTAYIEGIEINQNAAISKLIFSGAGTYSGRVLTLDSQGRVVFLEPSSIGAGDNLGSHIATKTLDMAGYEIKNISKLDFGNSTLYITTSATQGDGVFISTNIQINGDIYANKLYGDGTSLSGVATLTNTTPWRILRVNNNQQVIDAGIYQAGSDGITVDASSFTVVNVSLFKAQVDMEGALNVKGNVTLGDQSTDILTIVPLAATLSSVGAGQKYEYKASDGATIAFFKKKSQ